MHCSHLPRRCSSFTLVHVLSDVLYPRWINISTQPHPRISRLYPCLVHLKAVTPSLAHCVPLNRGEWRRPRHRSCWMPAAAERDSCAGINFAGRIQRGKPGRGSPTLAEIGLVARATRSSQVLDQQDNRSNPSLPDNQSIIRNIYKAPSFFNFLCIS